jgi:DNA-binding MarR family transcriptional regulator
MTTANSGSLLREVARMYTRAQRLVAECNSTTNTQCHLLTELGRSGALPLSELGARVSLEKSWVSRAVEALAARGLVIKESNPADARSWLVTLTDEGVQTVNELNATLDAHAAQLLGCLNERDRAAVERSLSLLLKALREDASGACCTLPRPPKDSGPCC